MYYVDKNIKNLYRIFDQNGRKNYLRLDMNENPAGLPNTFIKKVLSKINSQLLSEYPETIEFTQVLANHLNINLNNICLVNGSSEGIRYIIQAFSKPRGKIIGVNPTYAMFEVYSKMYDRQFIPINYSYNLKMPLNNIMDIMDSTTQLMILVNPNNPIGNVYKENDFIKILNKAQKLGITVLIDEAYHYYYPNTFLEYSINNKFVFITRTFSKLFSLAGARLGYVIGHPESIKIVQKMCTPDNVNSFALLFAQSIIEEPKLIENLISSHEKGREYLQKTLKKHGYQYHGEAGNFLFIKPKTDADLIMKRLKEEKRILVKVYHNIGFLGNCIRVTTGEKKIMRCFLEAFFEIDC